MNSTFFHSSLDGPVGVGPMADKVAAQIPRMRGIRPRSFYHQSELVVGDTDYIVNLGILAAVCVVLCVCILVASLVFLCIRYCRSCCRGCCGGRYSRKGGYSRTDIKVTAALLATCALGIAVLGVFGMEASVRLHDALSNDNSGLLQEMSSLMDAVMVTSRSAKDTLDMVEREIPLLIDEIQLLLSDVSGLSSDIVGLTSQLATFSDLALQLTQLEVNGVVITCTECAAVSGDVSAARDQVLEQTTDVSDQLDTAVANVQEEVVDQEQQIMEEATNASRELVNVDNQLSDAEADVDDGLDVAREVETGRHTFTLVLLSLLLVPCVVLVVGLCMQRGKAFMFLFMALFSLLCVLLLLLGVHIPVLAALADGCGEMDYQEVNLDQKEFISDDTAINVLQDCLVQNARLDDVLELDVVLFWRDITWPNFTVDAEALSMSELDQMQTRIDGLSTADFQPIPSTEVEDFVQEKITELQTTSDDIHTQAQSLRTRILAVQDDVQVLVDLLDITKPGTLPAEIDSFFDGNRCGWIGVRYTSIKSSTCEDSILHIRLLTWCLSFMALLCAPAAILSVRMAKRVDPLAYAAPDAHGQEEMMSMAGAEPVTPKAITPSVSLQLHTARVSLSASHSTSTSYSHSHSYRPEGVPSTQQHPLTTPRPQSGGDVDVDQELQAVTVRRLSSSESPSGVSQSQVLRRLSSESISISPSDVTPHYAVDSDGDSVHPERSRSHSQSPESDSDSDAWPQSAGYGNLNGL